MSPRNDIAIYSPFASAFYEDPSSEAYQDAKGGGGAELQTTLLARVLAGDGLRVAHIVYPVAVMAPQPPSLEVVQRPPRARRRDVLGKLGETLGVWRALVAADARLYVFRTGLSGGVAAFVVGALFCFIRRRRLVLAASNDLDFIFERPDRSRLTEALYRLALTRTRRIVVQSEQQLGLARTAVGNSGRVRLIPSFAEPADDEAAPPKRDAFLWVGRLVEYKQPLRYVELARALPDVRFVMVAPTTGETTQALKQQLAGETTDLPNLEILAHLRRERTLELIRRSIAVVGTSHHEGMPNVFLEAWSRGVPVISLHFDPDGRIAREGMGICAQGSWGRFVEAVKRLPEDPELRATLGDSGRRYVARVHSPAIVGAHWITLLRGELGG